MIHDVIVALCTKLCNSLAIIKKILLKTFRTQIVIDSEQHNSVDNIDGRHMQPLAGPSCKRMFAQSEVLENGTCDEMLARVLQEEERWKMEKEKEKEKEEYCRLQVLKLFPTNVWF